MRLLFTGFAFDVNSIIGTYVLSVKVLRFTLYRYEHIRRRYWHLDPLSIQIPITISLNGNSNFADKFLSNYFSRSSGTKRISAFKPFTANTTLPLTSTS